MKSAITKSIPCSANCQRPVLRTTGAPKCVSPSLWKRWVSLRPSWLLRRAGRNNFTRRVCFAFPILSGGLTLTLLPASDRRYYALGIAVFGFFAASLCENCAAANIWADDTTGLAAVANAATKYVQRESPDTVFPFKPERKRATRISDHFVLAHYFPPFPISLDNKPPTEDHWNKHYLSPAGEGGKYATAGGFTRDRPFAEPDSGPLDWRYLNLAVDIARAERIGVDGFGVDIVAMKGEHHWDTEIALCRLTEYFPNFHFIPEFDTGILRDRTVQDFLSALEDFSKCKGILRSQDNSIIVIPYNAEAKPPAFWHELNEAAKNRGIPIHLVFDFLSPVLSFSKYIGEGSGFTWWGPRDGDVPESKIDEPIYDLIKHERVRLWLQPIVPQDFRPKSQSFSESHNFLLFTKLWQSAIERDSPAVHLLTWNDYSEATELSPSVGPQYVFYDLLAYFIQWYKFGKRPTPTRDALYYLSRNNLLAEVTKTSPPLLGYKLINSRQIDDDVSVFALATSPSTLEIKQGDTSKEFPISDSPTVALAPAVPGCPVFNIRREGIIVTHVASDVCLESPTVRFDALYRGGSSTRTYTAPPPISSAK